MTLFEFASEFQTAIVGIIGFGGVILTQVLNARYARQREEAALKSKRDAVTAAILTELKVFRDVIATNADSPRPEEGIFTHMPRPKRTVSTELMNELGLVHTNSLEDVLLGLLTIDEIGRSLIFLADESNEDFLTFGPDRFPAMAESLKTTLKFLDEAISSIEAETSLTACRSAKR